MDSAYFRILTLVVAGCALAFEIHGAESPPPSPAKVQAELAKVPATDPEPTNAPALTEGMLGKHPRLLFTTADIADLKKQIATDPILKKASEDSIGWAKRFKTPKAPPAVVKDDTSAIISVKTHPALAYAYALEHDPDVKRNIVDYLTMMLEQPVWNSSAEVDSNMGVAENMLVVGLLFDAVYSDLDPDLRTKLAANMLVHVRRMFWLGFEQRVSGIHYWQQDPQNNHRWHRVAGLAACLLAIADMKDLKTGYLLEQLKKEMDLLAQWLPPDGDCHEGAGYQTFGFFYLAIAAKMTDRVLGTAYLKSSGIHNAWEQQLYYWAPGQQSTISFGDCMNDPGAFDNQEAAFFIGPHLTRDKTAQAALVHYFNKHANNPKGYPYSNPWALLTFYDPTVGEGDYKAVPTSRLFADLGAASMRDSWDDNAVCLTFKCGPYGGYKLNDYAWANKTDSGSPHYINVAHDDPDANTFALGAAGDFYFHPGVYSLHKLTDQQSCITIDDKGQIGEGDTYSQPVKGVDMRKLAFVTGWKTTNERRAIVEGEAGKAYAALKRFRRTAVWMPGDYILLLDDIRADAAHRIAWRGNCEKAQIEKPEAGQCDVTGKSGKRLPFQVLSNHEFKATTSPFQLEGRFGNRAMQQFQFVSDAKAVKFACIMDPWQRKLETTLAEQGDTITLSVKGEGIHDTWTWTPAADASAPSSVAGTRDGKELIALTEKDKVVSGD